ncbi:MAG TPA: glycosyltransferase family 39 protein, partial [Ktedonobacterales bacterium]|nr:glycosyltransferase family 39 protein [Ktedonobacterales bacterium]
MSKLDFPSPLPMPSEAEHETGEWQTDHHERVLIHVRRIASVPPATRRTLAFAGAATLVLVIAVAAGFHYLYFLSHKNKPMPLFLLDSVFQVGIALLIALNGATLGTRIMRYLPRRSMTRLEVGLFAYGLGTGALALMTALIGLLHAYYFPVLLVELVAPLVILRRDLMAVIRAILPVSERFVLAELRPRTIAESAVFTVIMIMAALIGEHALVPLWGFDVFMYHFALPQRFLELHNLFGSPGIPQANLPYNNEMLNLLALNFKAEIGAAIVQTIFVGAMVLAVFALGLRLFSRQVAWLGMAIFLSTPVVLFYASSGLIDQHFAFMALISISALLLYHETYDRRLVILAGLLIGIGIGVKYQMIYLVGPMMIPFAWWSRPRGADQTQTLTVSTDDDRTSIQPAPQSKARYYFAWARA